MRWWWPFGWLLWVMTGGRCHRRKKMMGRGADGGCGTDERPCPVSRVPARSPGSQPGISDGGASVCVDLLSQATKILSESSPFDVADETSPSTVPTLPIGLANFLTRQSDSRKRHKKSHQLDVKKSAVEKSRSTSFWTECEDYFRDVTLHDVATLSEISSPKDLASRKCFWIPVSANSSQAGADNGENASVEDTSESFVNEELTNGNQLDVESDALAVGNLLRQVTGFVDLDLSHGLEWLLGCRNKVSLTSERPSKKRKLLGTDAGLEKLLVVCPCEGNLSLCHFCSKADTGKEFNRLIVCSNCKLNIHQKCYGVQDIDGSWQCSWCTRKDNSSDYLMHCVLCPKLNGALKPVHSNGENGGPTKFAHLFCSLWMPEVYIEDVAQMEPIMNVEGIKETRGRLVCNICKVKHGACLQCSRGTCRTSFHPICAREASHRMEIWGRYGSDNVELRAFCSKHSKVENADSPQVEDPLEPVLNDSHVVNHLPVTLSINRPQKLVIGRRNGDNMSACVDSLDENSEKSVDSDSQEIDFSDSKFLPGLASEFSDLTTIVATEKDVLNFSPHKLVKFAHILKKLIDRGKVDVNDVAVEIGVSPDSLISKLTGKNLSSDLGSKIVNWLQNHAFMGSLQKNTKLRIKSAALSKATDAAVDKLSAIQGPESDVPDPVDVMSVVPLRRTKSEMRVLKDEQVTGSSEELSGDHELAIENVCMNQHASQEPENLNWENVISEDVKPATSDTVKPGGSSSFYIHPYIQKLLQVQRGTHLKNAILDSAESSSSISLIHQNHHSCNGFDLKSNGSIVDQLAKAREMDVLKFSPKDELEGEIIYYQNRLLGNAEARKKLTERLTFNVTKSLPKEIDTARSRIWDVVLVNRYLSQLREAKKQGKKERKHKEAQAVLAAATAAAANSSRSSQRKDVFEESAHLELMPQAKEALSTVALPKLSSDKQSEFVQSISGSSKDHPRSCDICRRPESILKPILVCSSCKVAVHLDCYCTVKESSGPWNCELCEDLLASRDSGGSTINFWEKSNFLVECGLCGGTTGAFRKSTGGQWVHAFCAEWVLESSFRRGQANSVEGMETVLTGVDICAVCCRKYGVCIKCNYGHCRSTFHPSCARTAGLFMNIKSSGGKVQHKAYCQKHSSEQRAKAENQTYGTEELKRIKHIRVELERLRLLCERIIKREKIKRDLVLCSHDIFIFKRDHAAGAAIGRNPRINHEVSTESATTSLKGQTDDFKSRSDAVQRSDDTTVDSSVSVKRRTKVPISVDTDQKTDDDSSTSKNPFARKNLGRPQFSGKQIPNRRPSAADGGHRLRSRKAETFQKELLMTSDQASMKNSLLPKQYLYVPADMLPKEKQVSQDDAAQKPAKSDG